LIVLTLLLSACQAVESYSSRIIFSGDHELGGEVAVYGDLIILDGSVRVKPASVVTGSVYMIAGELTLMGEVDGDLTILDGSLTLGSDSTVNGDLNLGSSDVTRQPGSRVLGDTVEGFALPTEWVRQKPTLSEQVQSFLLQTGLMLLLALFLRRFLPRPLRRIELTLKQHPLVSVTVGALSAVIGLVLFIQLAFTVILIPISIAGLALMFLLVTVGWIAIGGLLANAVEARLPSRIPSSLLYLLSVSLISLIVDGLSYVPVIGAPLVLLMASAGIGSTLLTRFGYQMYTPAEDTDLL
jgi:cytoskeletal protein CcmA (bactofilin family)